MMAGDAKQLSNPFSSGSGGPNFETEVQSSFVVLMLTGGFAPCLPRRPIQKIKLQGKYAGFDTDDLIVFTGQEDDCRDGKILGQVKHSITITENSSVFGDVIRSGWTDFNDTNVFVRGKDVLALITGPLSATDISDVRTILEWARFSETAEEFVTKVETTLFSSSSKRTKLQAFRTHLDAAKGEVVTDEELFEFLKHFHLLGYDLDIRSGVMHAVLHSLIGPSLPQGPEAVWARIAEEVRYANQNAGTITRESLPDDLCEIFAKRAVQRIPEDLAQAVPPREIREWNTSEFASALVVANLLGSWDENSDGDTEIVKRLVDGPFEEWQSMIRRVLQMPESPLSLRNGVWAIKRRNEFWQTLGACVFDEHLNKLLECALLILKQLDPKFELEPDERFVARLRGKVLPHSRHIRKGLSESLALIGSCPEVLTNCSADMPETTAVSVIRQLFEQGNWTLWMSLNDVLPVLAEVEPQEFLSAVETALSQQPCPFDELFKQEGSGITGRSHLTGLLWALESIAWNAEYLVRATVALGSLADRDPGGQWANRPDNSLTNIYLPWLPQTTAPVEKRMVAVETLRSEKAKIAWKLLINLLPGQVTMSSFTHKPVWRRWIPADWTEEVTNEEYSHQVRTYADMAVQMAMEDRSKLHRLIQDFDNLPRPAFEKLLAHLGSEELKGTTEGERFEIWNALTKVAAKHRRHADTEWALPEDAVSRIEAAANELAPKDPQNLYRRLFCGRDWDLYEDGENWQEQEKQLEERRRKAVLEILATGGIESVIQFAEVVESPQQVGFSLACIADYGTDASVLPSMLNSEHAEHFQLAAGFVRGRLQKKGWTWADSALLLSSSKDEIAKLLMILPFTNETWGRVDQLLGDDATEYWSNVGVAPYQAEGDLRVAIDALIRHGRPWAAIDCLAKQAHAKKGLDKPLAVEALLDAVSLPESSGQHDVDSVVEVIKSLQNDPDTTEEDLFKIEWAYVSVLDGHHGATPKYLEVRLANDPAFYCEVIRTIFRSSNDEPSEEEPTEDQRALATNAYRLLSKWSTPPGTDEQGAFSGDAFRRWVDEVKLLASESGHLEVALSRIGTVLIHCPSDPSGLPIHEAVAEVLNSAVFDKMRHGYAIGIHNSRGVHFVDPTAGPEKELASKYRTQAEELENAGFHRVAVTLRSVAEWYDRDAKRIIEQHNKSPEEEE